MWNEAGFKAVEQDKILHPTRPLCLTFSAAGRFGSIEVSERGKGRHMAGVGDHEEIMKTALIIAIGFVLAVASAQDINDLANSYYQFTSDFNFDDIPDLAISKPLNTFGNAGGVFTFYLGNTNGEYREVGSIFMHHLAANLRRTDRGAGLLTVYIRDGGPGGDLISYSVTKTGIVEKAKRYTRARDGGPEEDQKLYQSFFDQDKRLKAELMKGNPQQGLPGYREPAAGFSQPEG